MNDTRKESRAAGSVADQFTVPTFDSLKALMAAPEKIGIPITVTDLKSGDGVIQSVTVTATQFSRETVTLESQIILAAGGNLIVDTRPSRKQFVTLLYDECRRNGKKMDVASANDDTHKVSYIIHGNDRSGSEIILLYDIEDKDSRIEVRSNVGQSGEDEPPAQTAARHSFSEHFATVKMIFRALYSADVNRVLTGYEEFISREISHTTMEDTINIFRKLASREFTGLSRKELELVRTQVAGSTGLLESLDVKKSLHNWLRVIEKQAANKPKSNQPEVLNPIGELHSGVHVPSAQEPPYDMKKLQFLLDNPSRAIEILDEEILFKTLTEAEHGVPLDRSPRDLIRGIFTAGIIPGSEAKQMMFDAFFLAYDALSVPGLWLLPSVPSGFSGEAEDPAVPLADGYLADEQILPLLEQEIQLRQAKDEAALAIVAKIDKAIRWADHRLAFMPSETPEHIEARRSFELLNSVLNSLRSLTPTAELLDGVGYMRANGLLKP